MFPRVFQARRLTCRVVFVAVCILPTTALVVFGAWRAAPLHHRAIRDELATTLAVKVSLSSVEHPRPGVTRVEGLELFDPESGLPLLSVPSIEARELQGGYAFSAASATLHTAQGERLYEELHRRLAGGDGSQAWRLDIQELNLRDANQRQLPIALMAKTEMGPSGPVVDVRFRVVGDTSKNASEIKLFRNRDTSPATTTFVLETGDKPLPCSLLGHFASAWNSLGTEATFAGTFWTIDARDGRRGQLSGKLNNVDLSQLVTQNFRHTLTGKAQLEIEQAVMHQGRLQVAEANIYAGPGSVGHSLLQAARSELQMPLFEPGFSGPDGLAAYHRLAAHVTLDWQGLRIEEYRSKNDQSQHNVDSHLGQRAGVVMTGGNNTILVVPQNLLPSTALLRTLAADDDDRALLQGPINTLAKWLPQPVILPPREARQIVNPSGGIQR